MRNLIKSLAILVLYISSINASDILAVVNGKNITTQVAPKDFFQLDKAMQKKVVDRLIEKRLASDFAFESGVMLKEEYKKALEHILKMSSDKKSKDGNLADMLEKESIKGYTKEQLESKKGLLAFDFILNEKAEQLKPSEEILQKYYESRKYKYDTPAQVELLTIIVEKENLAKEIISKIASAKDSLQEFSTLAKKYSLAPSRNNHGYFGKVPLNELNDVLKPVLKDMKRGEYTKEPVKTIFGYQIYYVLNDIPEFNSTFEAVKSRIQEEYIKKEIKNWAINKIQELKKDAKIQILI